MRLSKRDHILDAALSVVEHNGVAALTYEAVSERSGITKSGLLYHFSSKEALLVALHERLAELWEDELVSSLGGPPEAATATERLRAYAEVSARSASGPELRLMLEATINPEFDRPWKRVIARWLPDPSGIDPEDPDAMQILIARLAADGLWMADSLNTLPLASSLRTAIARHLTEKLLG
ncbi:TetR family transcriptional regulator [Microbacterium sp. A8/3-1]|uniref:TetR family transcriptional regulator n=1 Tax=Microbacterium sp. A8/3-1 TaxID=3160749 RepID=A0AAU7VVH1_9MICO